MIILIDNYDSFSYNLYQLAGSLYPDIKVIRNDACTVEELEEMKCSSFIDAVRKNNLSQLQANVQKRFETVNKYNVQKKNMIWVNDFSVIDNGIRYGNSKTTEQYRKHFCQVVLDSVEKSCMNRIRGTKKYSQMLSDYQKQILKYYLDQLLGKEAICPEEPVDNYNWLDLIR